MAEGQAAPAAVGALAAVAAGVASAAGAASAGFRPGPLPWLAAWAAGSEAHAAWQYRGMAARDARRRAALFPQADKQQQPQRGAAGARRKAAETASLPTASIVVPVLNEEAGLADTLQYLRHQLQPPAEEIIVADGGSSDRSVQIARRCGARVVRSGRGRARQMNSGAAVAKGDMLVFVHADAQPPPSLLTEAAAALSRPGVVLGGFRPLIEYSGQPLRFFSANNTLKTYYGPLLLRPLSFLRGLRCLFGDQTLFCRARDFRRVGGYDSRLPIMEDADLCIRLHMAGPAGGRCRRGRVVQINSVPNRTSGRRLASWGQAHATAVHVAIGTAWYCGASPQQLVQLYHRLYTDAYR